MELKDTIKSMTSKDYKDRFIAEHHQLKIRYEKLKSYCNKIEAAMIDPSLPMPPHTCPLELLREQQKYMGLYLKQLEIRANIERINLDSTENLKGETK